MEELTAPAKINLRLVVTGRRSDGYHHLSMLNACTTLADRIWISASSSGGVTLRERPSGLVRLPQDSGRTETNLASKAAKAFIDRFCPGTGIAIEIEKNIPSGAGLGGGSSDAAAVLRYLWRSIKPKASPRELYLVAATLGADIPYLLYGGLAIARGVGERLLPVPTALKPTQIALILPSWSIPTPALFAEYRKLTPKLGASEGQDSLLPIGAATATPCLDDLGAVIERVRNDLEPAVCAFSKQSFEALVALRKIPGTVTSITGSGSAMFTFFAASPPPRKTRETLMKEAEGHGCKVLMVDVKWEALEDAVLPE